MKNSISFSVIALLLLILSFFAGRYTAEKRQEVIKEKVKIEYRDTSTKGTISPKLIYVDKWNFDTTVIWLSPSLDSLREVWLKDTVKTGVFIAKVDSISKDSSRIKINVISDIPLSQKLKIDWELKYKIKETTTTKYVVQEVRWFDKFKFSVGVYSGYGLLNQKFEILIGGGIGYAF